MDDIVEGGDLGFQTTDLAKELVFSQAELLNLGSALPLLSFHISFILSQSCHILSVKNRPNMPKSKSTKTNTKKNLSFFSFLTFSIISGGFIKATSFKSDFVFVESKNLASIIKLGFIQVVVIQFMEKNLY